MRAKIEDLPLNVLDIIFSNLQRKQILQMRMINSTFKDYIDSMPVHSSKKFKVSDVRIAYDQLVLRIQYDNIGDDDDDDVDTDFSEYELTNDGVALRWIKTKTFIYEKSTVLQTSGYFKNFFSQITTFIFKSNNFAELCGFLSVMPKLNNLIIEKKISEIEIIKVLTCIKIKDQTTFFLSFDDVSLTRQVVDLFLSVMDDLEEHDLFVYPGIGGIGDPISNDAQVYYCEMRLAQKKVPKFLTNYCSN